MGDVDVVSHHAHLSSAMMQTGHMAGAVGNRQQAVIGALPYCLLPTAYCLLPTAYCLLPNDGEIPVVLERRDARAGRRHLIEVDGRGENPLALAAIDHHPAPGVDDQRMAESLGAAGELAPLA